MYVFGGCTQSSCNAAFNDLWRLDLNSKEWIRPLASGTRLICITLRPVLTASNMAFKTQCLRARPSSCLYSGMSEYTLLFTVPICL